jgi:hypothetical protein
MDRVRLTPEEIVDLMSPVPGVHMPWLKPISAYDRRTETSECAGARFG